MTTSATQWQYRIIRTQGARSIAKALTEYRTGAYTILTVENVNNPDEIMDVRLSVIGVSHTNESLAAMAGDPTYDRPPVWDFHGWGKFVDGHGKPLVSGDQILYLTGVVDTGEQSGGFNITD